MCHPRQIDVPLVDEMVDAQKYKNTYHLRQIDVLLVEELVDGPNKKLRKYNKIEILINSGR